MFVILRFTALLGAISTLAVATPVPHREQPRTDPGEVNVITPVGLARGLQTSTTSSRFSVRYATAPRWGLPVQATSWLTSMNDINKLPPACPQAAVDASAYSEDCLHLVVYTPVPKPSMLSMVPILVWIHGGSFYEGSASDSGLDGAALAKATNSVVVVIQYRLGVLAFVPPSSQTGSSNLALRDVITALKFIKQNAPSFGGDTNRITVAGQSSGGQMIRALLGTPSASNLFKYAAIHSDPVDYGFYKPATISGLQNYLYTSTSGPLAQCTTFECEKNVSVADVLAAQLELLNAAPWTYPETFGGSVLRPCHDGQLLQYTLTGNSFPPAASLKPLLVLTVKDEAGTNIGYAFDGPADATQFDDALTLYYPAPRREEIIQSDNYNATAYSSQAGVAPGDENRAALTQLFTDGFWRCPSWTLSRNWASRGGVVFTGEFQIGATYPVNSGVSYCTQPGRVCHQDDIYILFGTTPSPTPAQTRLTQEMQARYSSFIRGGYPNPPSGGYATWPQSGSSDVKAIKLGGTGNRAAEACDPSFWGSKVPYDYQVYGL